MEVLDLRQQKQVAVEAAAEIGVNGGSGGSSGSDASTSGGSGGSGLTLVT